MGAIGKRRTLVAPMRIQRTTTSLGNGQKYMEQVNGQGMAEYIDGTDKRRTSYSLRTRLQQRLRKDKDPDFTNYMGDMEN